MFVSRGYGGTSTPEICGAAGITRGALYHHFDDKRDLFRAVLMREARAVSAAIEGAAPAQATPRQALLAGSLAYLDAMTVAGRTRLLLIEGPAVLGAAEVMAIDASHAAGTLREGLAAALGAEPVAIDALAKLLSAAFDRAALEIDAGSGAQEVRSAMLWLLERVLGPAAASQGQSGVADPEEKM
ncbi:TetR family transcriptional regulator [Caldimonas brevitalea]|uniref:TetR family transcriptional regulator n=1 Tax=Caldimonas brevitalea TaxID=413882 RepID=A0A0G3BN77_9BURK|nr:TetR family transcriptional regulator [Caldimonas brevitalea]